MMEAERSCETSVNIYMAQQPRRQQSSGRENLKCYVLLIAREDFIVRAVKFLIRFFLVMEHSAKCFRNSKKQFQYKVCSTANAQLFLHLMWAATYQQKRLWLERHDGVWVAVFGLRLIIQPVLLGVSLRYDLAPTTTEQWTDTVFFESVLRKYAAMTLTLIYKDEVMISIQQIKIINVTFHSQTFYYEGN